MADTMVQIHPHMHKLQQQPELRKRYDIPHIPHALTSSSDDECYNGGHASLSPATSFISIDGDYDDVETSVEAGAGVVMPLFSGGYVVATFATAPPLDDDEDNLVANVPENNLHAEDNKHRKHNKIKSTPTNPKPIEEGGEICIICYERVEEERGDFQRDFCNTCKYTVHIGCIDDYVVRKVVDAVHASQMSLVGISSVPIKCLMCSKEVERVLLYEDNNITARINANNGDGFGAEQRRQIQNHQYTVAVMERQLRRERRSRMKQILCNICFLLLVVLCGLAVLLSVILKR
jgi:hypothetical protein